jgi:chromosome segregation ATPase
LQAYNTNPKPAQEKLEDLFVTIREAVKISNQISQKSNALYNTTKVVIDEIKNVVNVRIQKLTQDLTKGREEIAGKVIILAQLSGRQKLIESKIKNLRDEISKASSPERMSELEVLLEKQQENLAFVNDKISDIRSAGEKLEEDLEKLIDNNSKLAEIAERLDDCPEEANSHTQAVMAAADKINLPGIVGAALGAGGVVLLGAGAGLAAAGAVAGAAIGTMVNFIRGFL